MGTTTYAQELPVPPTPPRSQADCAAGEVYMPPPPCGTAFCVDKEEMEKEMEMMKQEHEEEMEQTE